MKESILLLLAGILLGFYAKAQIWEAVGNPAGISVGSVGRLTLVSDYQDHLVVGYYNADANVKKGSVQKFDGTSWAFLDEPGITESYATYNSTCVDSEGIVYFTNQASWPAKGVRVRKFENKAWTQLPSPNDVNTINHQASAVSADDVLFVFTGENSGTVVRYVNGAWEQVGNTGFSGGVVYYADMAIAADGKVYISWNVNGFVHCYINNVDASSTDPWTPVGGVANIAPATNTEF